MIISVKETFKSRVIFRLNIRSISNIPIIITADLNIGIAKKMALENI